MFEPVHIRTDNEPRPASRRTSCPREFHNSLYGARTSLLTPSYPMFLDADARVVPHSLKSIRQAFEQTRNSQRPFPLFLMPTGWVRRALCRRTRNRPRPCTRHNPLRSKVQGESRLRRLAKTLLLRRISKPRRTIRETLIYSPKWSSARQVGGFIAPNASCSRSRRYFGLTTPPFRPAPGMWAHLACDQASRGLRSR